MHLKDLDPHNKQSICKIIDILNQYKLIQVKQSGEYTLP